jgi:YggT family protein
LIQVIISWVNPGMYNPVMGLLHSLNEPLLAPARRLIPPISGLDLSPIAVIIVLQLASMLAVAPIRDLGRAMLL